MLPFDPAEETITNVVGMNFALNTKSDLIFLSVRVGNVLPSLHESNLLPLSATAVTEVALAPSTTSC